MLESIFIKLETIMFNAIKPKKQTTKGTYFKMLEESLLNCSKYINRSFLSTKLTKFVKENNSKKMIQIYHNPKCSKSREGLCVLQDLSQEVEIINYMNNPLTVSELKNIIKLLNIKPIELVRVKEAIWKENFKDKNLTDDEIIEAMVENPKLIERPIVVNGNKAVIARPIEKIDEIV